ncbi:NlpC/P60 family protein [Nocardioides sp. GY 10113]|uniref:C40 family peptidase n=1 Tax=Nocardioides sp. GY 10113 TaxID=2569761 RepID=UPI0010A7A3FA|nr:C40 family peptidase [Nocardioides sp. GY 10113]TIC89205.1 NlpC/P60 family protein [Nocardioides sp. GY 10113]
MRRPERTRPLAPGSAVSLLIAAMAALLVVVLVAPGAKAAPADDPTGGGTGADGSGDAPTRQQIREARAEQTQAADTAAQVQAALAAADAALDAAADAAARAAEAFNGARWRAQRAQAAEREAVAEAARAADTLEEQRVAYREVLIATLGTELDLSAFTALVDSDGVSTLLANDAAVDRVQGVLAQQRDAYLRAVEAAEAAEQRAARAASRAEDALAAARDARDAAAAAQAAAAARAADLTAQRDDLVRRLAQLEGVAVALVEERRTVLARRAAARAQREAAAAAQPAESTPSAPPAEDPATSPESSPTPEPEPAPAPAPAPAPEPAPEPAGPPAPSGGAAAAVAFARAQIGEPYVWGAAGPSSWDCSGLTMAAWQAGGRALPHYSVAQYQVSTPISPADLRPGDLVFWGSGAGPGSIYHVALYAGGGMIIHAPRTGRPVSEESMYAWRTPDFYARP